MVIWIANKSSAATGIPVAAGISSAIASLTTDYEMGAVKKAPVKMHLNLDIASGLFLAASPFLFGFYKKMWL